MHGAGLGSSLLGFRVLLPLPGSGRFMDYFCFQSGYLLFWGDETRRLLPDWLFSKGKEKGNINWYLKPDPAGASWGDVVAISRSEGRRRLPSQVWCLSREGSSGAVFQRACTWPLQHTTLIFIVRSSLNPFEEYRRGTGTRMDCSMSCGEKEWKNSDSKLQWQSQHPSKVRPCLVGFHTRVMHIYTFMSWDFGKLQQPTSCVQISGPDYIAYCGETLVWRREVVPDISQRTSLSRPSKYLLY